VDPVEGIAGFILANLDPGLLLARLDLVPELVVDYAQLRHLDDLKGALGIDAGDLLARPWVLYIGGAVPFQAADIEGVVQ
jgi:hypothetical protein